MSSLSPVQLNGLDFKKLKSGVTTWPSDGEPEERMIELAMELRALCSANQGKNYIVEAVDAMPRCTCPFSAANHRKAKLSWCALYGRPTEWEYFEEVPEC